ncbi:MAG: hypothetical protein RLY85_1073 [Bacteroidota bacterium]
MRKVFHASLLPVACLALLYSILSSGCGQQVAPTGGPKDSLPPKLMAASPAYKSLEFKGNKIVLLFDEYVTLESPFEKLIYSPTPKYNPTAESKLKTITIKIKDTLEENTTYRIDFGNALKDINENNVLQDFSFTFSTGKYIDSAYLTGKVFLAEDGKTDSTLIAVLHRNFDDSAVAKEKPRYYAPLKGDGSFYFGNLKPGRYNIFALKDADGGKKYDQSSEMIAFLNNSIEIGKDTAVTLYAFEEERTKSKSGNTPSQPRSTAKKRNPEDTRLRLANNLEAGRQDLLLPFILKSEFPLKGTDTSKLLLADKDYNRVKNYSVELDTTGKNIVIRNAWTENTSYALILQKGFASDTIGNTYMRTDTLKFGSKKIADYGSLDIKLENLDTLQHPILLLYKDNIVAYRQVLKDPRYTVKLFVPGEYEVKLLFDTNNNGSWDTGNYWKKLQPERVVARKQRMQIRANWDNELKLDLKAF